MEVKKMNGKYILGGLVLVGIVAILAIAGHAGAATINVPGDYSTIQDAIDNASNGDTIIVSAGVYTEQLDINKDITIQGAGAGTTIILSPDSLATKFTTSDDNKPIVYIHDVDNVIIKNLTINGSGKGNANYRFEGVAFYDAGGTLQNLEVKSIIDTPMDGAQHGIGIYAWDNAGTDRTVKIENCNVYEFQKNGMALNGANLYAEVRNCTVTGSGPLDSGLPAQNGIQLGWGATGIIDNNTVSDLWYTGGYWGASGIMVYGSDGVKITNNTLNGTQLSVAYYYGNNGIIANNTIINGEWPIVLYSSDVYMYDNNFVGNEHDITYAAEIVGTNHFFDSIQSAIDAASDGDTIKIYDGEYWEDITVNKAITLTGEHSPFEGTSIINGTIDVTADGATIKWLKVKPGGVSGNEAGIAVYASHVTIDSNIVEGMNGDGTGTIKGIHIYGGSSPGIGDIEITNNLIMNIDNPSGSSSYGGADGIMIQGIVNGVSIDNNTIKDIHSAGWAYGIEITPTGSAPSNPPQGVSITGNTVEKVNDGSVYSGVTDPSSAPYPGVCLIIDVYGTTPANASQVVAHYNNFINPVGAWNFDSSHTLNATLNYWNAPSGPNATTNPDGKGAIVGEHVDFIPWLDSMYPDTDYGNGKESPVDYANVTDIPGGATTTVNVSGMNASIVITSTSPNSVTVLRYMNNPEGDLPAGAIAVGNYIDLSVGDPGSVDYPIYLRINYTAADLAAAGLTEDELLGIAYWDGETGCWVLYANTGVNTTNFGSYDGYVWAYIYEGELSPKVIMGGTYTYPTSHLTVTLDPAGHLRDASTFHIWATGSSAWKIKYRIDNGEIKEGAWNKEVHFQLNRNWGYEPGKHTIEYWAVDPGTYEEQHHIETYIVDNKGPEVSISFDGIFEVTKSNVYEIATSTEIMANATDESGVAKISYKIDDGDWQVYTQPFTMPSGYHNLYVVGYDILGNVGNMRHYSIDVGGGKPETSLITNPSHPDGNNGWYVSSVEVELNANDDGSGVAKTLYRVDDGDWQVYTQPFTIGDGVHTIHYYSIDNVGNVENTKSSTIKIDMYAPEINIEKPRNYLYIFNRAIIPLTKPVIIGKITFEADIVDTATSGTDRALLYIDGNTVDIFANRIQYTLDETMFGTHTMKIVAYDRAGNMAVMEEEFIILSVHLSSLSS